VSSTEAICRAFFRSHNARRSLSRMGLKLNSQFHIAIRDTHETKYFQLPLRVIILALAMGVFESGFCDMVAISARLGMYVQSSIPIHHIILSTHFFQVRLIFCLQNGSKNGKVQPEQMGCYPLTVIAANRLTFA